MSCIRFWQSGCSKARVQRKMLFPPSREPSCMPRTSSAEPYMPNTLPLHLPVGFGGGSNSAGFFLLRVVTLHVHLHLHLHPLAPATAAGSSVGGGDWGFYPIRMLRVVTLHPHLLAARPPAAAAAGAGSSAGFACGLGFGVRFVLDLALVTDSKSILDFALVTDSKSILDFALVTDSKSILDLALVTDSKFILDFALVTDIKSAREARVVKPGIRSCRGISVVR
ncbi:hypothetical protein BZA05DRAFT_419974 [Tricharina praecox]|uniref:uncharacterized protein n=1 Tax=Tricharina praecox TaxID=43433 RepID=UPI0022211213|nr:uncharacterized protein BZA05DRAFT_419974 [Tricharina praecox]KAI5848830.1 hypothetical protein BZA05DRAFT_419974 [Tricharina praecox]